MMASYCGKYMKSESLALEEAKEEKGLTAAQKKLPPKLQAAILKKKKGSKVSDNSEEEPKKDNEDSKKNCNCESDDFLNSLTKQVATKKSFSEESLIEPVADLQQSEEPQPGEVGFAPQGRVNSIGGGYSKEDFADIPVLGESHKFPTLTEWMANRFNKQK
jgi:hypothetical protein